MHITSLRIENFRSVKDLDVALDDTTVFIGANNSGKTAILEAARIALSRRWGRRGSGFTEHDVHCATEPFDAKAAPPVTVTLKFVEPPNKKWDSDMVSALDSVVVLTPAGGNLVSLRVTCAWDKETEAFEPSWEFLNASDQPMTGAARRSTNTQNFFSYCPIFYLAAIRNAEEEFNSRSQRWSSLLRSIRIPADVETDVQATINGVDDKVLTADPKLKQIADKIGEATKITVRSKPGEARLRMLPLNMWDLISRANVVVKQETLRPWLPLSQHGQGLQSLSVVFLFQAAAASQLEEEQPGTEPIFLLEEPETHLHPQAARTLWERIRQLPGQKLVTTHSPYFVQNVPLHNLRLVRQEAGATKISYLPKQQTSNLPWNTSVQQYAENQAPFLFKDSSGNIATKSCFGERIAEAIAGCFRQDKTQQDVASRTATFRHAARGLITEQEERELSFLGRRIRGEIFFASRWVLVEGQTEHVLIHAIGRALGFWLDQHGVAVIDFQNCGDADTYPALATSFEIPWTMITDADNASKAFRAQLMKRGFTDDDLKDRFLTLTPPNTLEEQLIADGHEPLLRKLLGQTIGDDEVAKLSAAEFLAKIKKNKTGCISRLALAVEADAALARKMPKAFVDVVDALKKEVYGS